MTYPCSNCLLKNICSESCDEYRELTNLEISVSLIHIKKCPFCGDYIDILNDLILENTHIRDEGTKCRNSTCRRCKMRFRTFYDEAGKYHTLIEEVEV